MGLMMAQLAPRASAASVTVVDRNPALGDAAKEVGDFGLVLSADETVRPGGWEGGHRLHRGGPRDRGRIAEGPARRHVPAVRGGRHGGHGDVLAISGLQRRDHHRRLDGGPEHLMVGRSRCSLREPCGADRMVSHSFCLADYGEALGDVPCRTRPKAADSAPNRRVDGDCCSTQLKVQVGVRQEHEGRSGRSRRPA